MAFYADILDHMVSITQFNKGQATKIFNRARAEGHIIVLKNNEPEAVIISPEEYKRMAGIIEDYELAQLAEARLANGNIQNAIPMEQVMKNLGITQADLDSAEKLNLDEELED